MSAASLALLKDIDVDKVVDGLDALASYHLVAMHWCYGVIDRLQGFASALIEDDLEKVAADHLAASRTLAARIGQLGDAATSDPSLFAHRSGVGAFELPADTGDVRAILGYALEQARKAVTSYAALLDRVRGRDVITERLLIDRLSDEIARENELETILGSATKGERHEADV